MSVQCISQAFAYDAPSPTAKLVLLALANYADENAQCFPPVKRIVRETGLSERAVRNAIKALIDCGCIEKAERRRKNGTQTSDLFTLFPAGGQTARRAGSPQTASRAGGTKCRSKQTAPDAGCEANRLHDVPVQTAPDAGPTTFEPSLEPSLAAVEAREPAAERSLAVVTVTPVVEAIVPTGDDWPDGDARRHAELLVHAASTIHLDPARQPALATTTGRIHAWRRDGASWEHDVLPVVTAMAQRQRRPVASWKFFDSAIAQSIADNRQALQIPEARHASQADARSPSAKLNAKRENHDRHLSGFEQAAGLVAARRAY